MLWEDLLEKQDRMDVHGILMNKGRETGQMNRVEQSAKLQCPRSNTLDTLLVRAVSVPHIPRSICAFGVQTINFARCYTSSSLKTANIHVQQLCKIGPRGLGAPWDLSLSEFCSLFNGAVIQTMTVFSIIYLCVWNCWKKDPLQMEK